MPRPQPHAFLSYVRENEVLVDRLYRDLKVRGISVWVDRHQLKPGMRWKDAIRCAISEGAFFLGCFSKESIEKNKSYMNEELAIAIEELRLRPTDRAWFIPVRLNTCSIPRRTIGGGETLADIQWVDLSENWSQGVDSLASILLPEHAMSVALFEEAFDELLRNFGDLTGEKCPRTGDLTIAITGNTGVGKTTLIQTLTGNRNVGLGSGVAVTERIKLYEWPSVGHIADIPAISYYNEQIEREAHDFMSNKADVLFYTISATLSRIHRGDLENLSRVRDRNIPCLVIVNKIDCISIDEERQIMEYVKRQTGCPVVVVSAFLEINIQLLRELVYRLTTVFSRSNA